MRKKIYLAFALVALLFSSCATPNVSYFSDLGDNQSIDMMQDLDIRLRPEDKISIIVKSMDPKLSDLFNLPIIAHRVGYSQESTLNNAQQVSVYTIDSKGDIDFPVLGKIKVAGSKREHVAQVIKDQLVDRNLVKDPVVTVEYANLCFNVLGEVNKPGRYTFDRDHITILDALSKAGDLTIQGRRENVFVMREEGNQRKTYRVNLLNGRELLSSPAYYLQQNDVVYVEPNDFRARQTQVNGNNVLAAPFWISVASLLTSVAVLIVK